MQILTGTAHWLWCSVFLCFYTSQILRSQLVEWRPSSDHPRHTSTTTTGFRRTFSTVVQAPETHLAARQQVSQAEKCVSEEPPPQMAPYTMSFSFHSDGQTRSYSTCRLATELRRTNLIGPQKIPSLVINLWAAWSSGSANVPGPCFGDLTLR